MKTKEFTLIVKVVPLWNYENVTRKELENDIKEITKLDGQNYEFYVSSLEIKKIKEVII